MAELAPDHVAAGLAADTLTFIDTRTADEVPAGTVEKSLNIPARPTPATHGASVMDPETDKNPLGILATGQDQAQEVRDRRRRRYVTSLDGFPTTTPALQRAELGGGRRGDDPRPSEAAHR